MRKLFTFLCAALMSVGMWATTVTWNSSDLPDASDSFSKDGVTLTCDWIEKEDGTNISGPGTFTTDLGNFSKIEVNADDAGVSGDGWDGSTWTGNAASVSFEGEINFLSSIVFTIASAAPTVPSWVREGDEWEDATKTLTVNSNLPVNAYMNKTGIEHVIINNGVTSIGQNAFLYCEGIKSVTIPNSVTSIGNAAFQGCFELKSVTIPNSVTSIGDDVFNGCDGMTSITIPNSVTSIGNRAFYWCSGLTSIEIPNSVTSIGGEAFSKCTGLTSITIPNSVTSIGGSAFYQTPESLTSIVVESGNTNYDSRGNCNAIIETSTNKLIAGCKNTIIPNSVTSIGDYAFFGCTGLTSVTIPNGVTSIGEWAFCWCWSLPSITFPSSVTSIGGTAFQGCYALTSLTCGATTPPTLGSGVFAAISGKSNIPLYVPYGSVAAYEAAEQWNEFNIQAIPAPTPTVVASGNCGPKVGEEYSDNLTWTYYSDNSLVIEGSGAMADFEFSYATYDMDYPWINYRNQITSVSVGEGITTIGNSAFSEFTDLQSISLPSTLQTIGSTVFYYCEKLPSITIPANVTSIGVSTFSYCELLASANIPVGVTLIPESLFYDCHALQTIVLPEGVQSIGEEAFYSCYGLTNISFPSTLTQIGDYVFNWSTSLASITLPESIESIGEAAFAACTSLTNVTMLGSTPATLGEAAFRTLSSSLTFTVPTCELIDTYAAAGYDTYVDANYQSSSTSIVSATGDCGGSTPTAVEIGDPNNASEIETFLTNNDGQTIDELIIDRPVLNNMYNTLCLPFDMNATQIAASSLNGVEIFELNSVEVVNDELFLGLSDAVNAVVAGRPYIVKYSAASQLDDLDFENVTINNADLTAQAVTMNGVTFKGTFTPFVMGIQNGFDTNGGYLFLGQNNVLYWPNTDNPLKPFRAYFYIDLNSGSSNAPLRFGMPARIGRPASTPTGVESIQPSAVSSQKVMIDGVLYIIRGEHMYDAQGQIVK